MIGQPSSGSGGRKHHALGLFAGLARDYDRVGAALSLGQDPRWRRTMVEKVGAKRDERVLDVATGTGLVAQALVRRYGCAVVGVDQSPEMLAVARSRSERDRALGERLTLISGEAERLPFADGEFDHLTFTYLLRYVDDPAATLRELARVVRFGGRVASLEFGVPRSPVWHALWTGYTRIGLPALGRLVSPAWSETGRFLARSIPEFYARHPLEHLIELWSEAGIASVRIRRMSLGGGVVMWGTRDGGRRGSDERPAFYAPRPGGWRDVVTLLHPCIRRGTSATSRSARRWHRSCTAIGSRRRSVRSSSPSGSARTHWMS